MIQIELLGRTPCLSDVQRILILYPRRCGWSIVLWLPLTGYARQHPERQEWRAVPALDSRRIYVNFRGGGDGGRVQLGWLLRVYDIYLT